MKVKRFFRRLLCSILIVEFVLYSIGTPNVFAFSSNVVPGFQTITGTWKIDSQGILTGQADSGNGFDLSVKDYDDFTFETDITLDSTTPDSVASLILRAGQSEYSSYGLQLDRTQNRIRLVDFYNDRTLQVYSCSLSSDIAYHIAVTCSGSNIVVALDGQEILQANDTAYTSGRVGFNVYNGKASFDNAIIKTSNSNLSNLSAVNGTWEAMGPYGIHGTTAPNDNAFYLTDNAMSNYILESDVRVDSSTPDATAKLIFEADSQNSYNSYGIDLDPNLDIIRLFDFSNGQTISQTAYNFLVGQSYHIRLVRDAGKAIIFVDGKRTIDVTLASKGGTRVGVGVYNGQAHFNNLNQYDLNQVSALSLSTYDKNLMVGDTEPPTVYGTIGSENVELYGAVQWSITPSDSANISADGIVTVTKASDPLVVTATRGTMSTTLSLNTTTYNESFRPQMHYSPRSNLLADSRGVYFNGKYHFFYQGENVWCHATSTDLVHWKSEPVALFGDQNGSCWAGSVVADVNNTSGLFKNPGGGMVIAYTSSYEASPGNFIEQVSLAYSDDDGATWKKYSDNPVIRNTSGLLFRDPKIFWYAPEQKWVMAIARNDVSVTPSINDIAFYSSANLKDWTYMSSFGSDQGSHSAIWECPDIFPLPVQNSTQTKWVLVSYMGSNPTTDGSVGQYFVGDFDGTTFHNDNSASTTLWLDQGKDFYACTSFENVPDGRRLWMGWLGNWKYPFSTPTTQFKGTASIMRELSLKDVSGQGIRLIQNPIDEVRGNCNQIYNNSNMTINPGEIRSLNKKMPYGIIDVEFDATAGSEFGLDVRAGGENAVNVGYMADQQKAYVNRSKSGQTWFSDKFTDWFEGNVQPINGKIKFTIVVDNTSLEVFVNDGECVFSTLIFPGEADINYNIFSRTGTVTVDSIQMYASDSIWGNTSNSTQVEKILTNTEKVIVAPNGTGTLYYEFEPYNLTGQNVTYSLLDPSVATVTQSGNTFSITGGSTTGQTTLHLTETTSGVTKDIPIIVSQFNTNLSNWNTLDGQRWSLGEQGVVGKAGVYYSTLLNQTQLTDFNLNATVSITPEHIFARSGLTFRANPNDDEAGYALYLDPFNDKIVLTTLWDLKNYSPYEIASASLPIDYDTNYNLSVQVVGNQIQVSVNGQQVINVNNTFFTVGSAGLLLYDGISNYQDVNVN